MLVKDRKLESQQDTIYTRVDVNQFDVVSVEWKPEKLQGIFSFSSDEGKVIEIIIFLRKNIDFVMLLWCHVGMFTLKKTWLFCTCKQISIKDNETAS